MVKLGHKMSNDHNNIAPHRERNLRSNRKLLLNIPKIKTNKVEKTFIIKSTRYWNSITEDHTHHTWNDPRPRVY